MEARRGIPRITKQRKAIFQAIQGDTSHPTAEELYLRVKEEMPTISLATVYRNLKLLAEEGLILEISRADGPNRYDYQTHEHYHFLCDQCGIVQDLEIPVQSHLDSQLNAQGFSVRTHETIFHGLCCKCSCENIRNSEPAN